uniref:Ferrochelatase n=1 Tax=Panagrolaimus superbus TaxID=310955 RepID=A0A914XW42_9BILA
MISQKLFTSSSFSISKASFATSKNVVSTTTETSKNATTKLPSKSGTNILLIHAGQPRTPFYTREYLTKLWGNYKIPKFCRQPIADAYWNSSKLLKKCVTDCEKYPILNEVIDGFSLSIERSLASITPEFRPVKCRSAYLFDTPTIEESIENIIQEGTDNLIILSLYPFEVNHLTKPMLSTVEKVLQKRTKSFGNDASSLIRVAQNSHVSFHHTTLSNIATNESIIQYWAERIRSNLDGYDSVIFTSSLPLSNRRKFTSSFCETAKRVMYVLYDSYPKAIPWRISYHSSWEQFWPPLTQNTLQNQVKNLRKNGRNKTLVIPFSELFQNFDTETILPALISTQKDVHLLSPEINDKALIHSITEVLKNSLLQKIAAKEFNVSLKAAAAGSSNKILV